MTYLRVLVSLLCLLALLPTGAQAQAGEPASTDVPEGFVSYSAPIQEALLSVAYPETWHFTNVFEKNDWRPVFTVTRRPTKVFGLLEGYPPQKLEDNAIVVVTLLLGAEKSTPLEIVRAAGEMLPRSLLRDVEVTQEPTEINQDGEAEAVTVLTGTDSRGTRVINKHLAFFRGGRLVHVSTLVAEDQEAESAPLIDRIIASITVGKAP